MAVGLIKEPQIKLEKLYPTTSNPGWRVTGSKNEKAIMISSMLENYTSQMKVTPRLTGNPYHDLSATRLPRLAHS